MDFIYYLIKVILCSGVLCSYYLLALRNRKFHQWNRFYLLSVLFLSLLIPAIRINISQHPVLRPEGPIHLIRMVQSANQYLDEANFTVSRSFSFDYIFMGLYLLTSLLLFVLTIYSIFKIIKIIRENNPEHMGSIKFFNTSLPGTPFTFFNYIFWNPEIDLHSQTGRQIFKHEIIHAEEKHSFDKILLQLIVILFWCNPFFWFIKKELKIVHEFIADQKSVALNDTSAFASMILMAAYPNKFNSVTNHFFQSSIKRRLSMLTKIRNPKYLYSGRLLAIPVLAIIIMAFGIKTNEYSPAVLAKNITVVIDAGHGGNDRGAINGNVSEAELNLSIAKKIKETNTNKNINILLSRSSADLVKLQDRVTFAKENHADLFISIHVNADQPGTQETEKNGIEVIIPKNNPIGSTESQKIGSAVIAELSPVYKTNPLLQVKTVGIYVLNASPCPAVLIECGYLTNTADKNYFTKERNQETIAKKILNAIEDYAVDKQSIKPSQVQEEN